MSHLLINQPRTNAGGIRCTIADLVSKLSNPEFATSNVITWASPVPSFGDVSRSKIATLGLNPSNREFVDEKGNELKDGFRRFHSLGSLGLKDWHGANEVHLEQIEASCREYFFRNPYDAWFRQLDFLLSGIGASYYDWASTACHLDLIPYATACKWVDLSVSDKHTLLDVSIDFLGRVVRSSPIETIVLNGRSVVHHFEQNSDVSYSVSEMPEWSLRRGAKSHVAGIGYVGSVRRIGNIPLRKTVLILGYNHNIQSSFGVTKSVRNSIRSWITATSGLHSQ